MGTDRTLIYLPLDDVEGAFRNPKLHDLGPLRGSISRFGFTVPALRDERTGRLVTGHGRIEVLASMRQAGQDPPAGVRVDEHGRWLVPVICGWASRSDAEADAYLLADNRHTERAGWDRQQLADILAELAELDHDLTVAAGWDPGELDDLLKANEAPDLDDLAGQVGEPGDSDGWPTVRLKIPHHLSAAWESHLDTYNGDVPAAFAKLLDLDPEPPAGEGFHGDL